LPRCTFSRSIGIQIIEYSDSKTITSKGIFKRITKKELFKYYTSANIKKIEFIDVESVWFAIVGVK